MGRTIVLLILSALVLSLNSLQLVYGRKKICEHKNLKKLSKSEVQVKTYLFPCSFAHDKEVVNSSFGSPHHHMRNCKRKLVIKMTVNSGGEYYTKTNGFIPVDHVIDGVTGRKKRLLTPLMIRVKREKMYQLYDLQIVKSVNAEAKEEVINYENTPNFTGCDTSSSHPTCGFSFFNNKIIQFSEGFCCSCDQNKNDARQPCDGHTSDSKDFRDMEYAAHRRRSNRTSRDLETAQQKIQILEFGNINKKKAATDINSEISSLFIKQPIMNLNKDVPQSGSSPQLGKSNNIKENVDILKSSPELSNDQNRALNSLNILKVDGSEGFKPVLNPELLKKVTVKSFEFDHTYDKNRDNLRSVIPINFVIGSEDKKQEKSGRQTTVNGTKSEGDRIVVLSKTVKLEDPSFDQLNAMEGNLNEYFESAKHSGKGMNNIDKETFKLLMMKRIKDNKNREEKNLFDDKQPASKEEKSDSKVEEQSSKIKETSLKAKEPGTKDQAICSKDKEPRSKVPEPSSKVQEPSSKAQGPSSKVQEPGCSKSQGRSSKVLRPSSKIQGPSSKVQGPSSKAQGPSSNVQEPSSKDHRPNSKVQEPGCSKVQGPSSKVQEPSSKVQEPGCSKVQGPSSKVQELCSKVQEPCVKDSESVSKHSVIYVNGKGAGECKINTNNGSCVQRFDFVNKNGKKGFTLKIENDNSELRLQVITKKPKNCSVDKTTLKGQKSRKTTTQRMKTKNCKTYNPRKTTKKGLKQRILPKSVLEYFDKSKKKKITTKDPKKLKSECSVTTVCTKTTTACSTQEREHTKKTSHKINFSTSKCAFQSSNPDEPNNLFLPFRNVAKLKDVDVSIKNETRNVTDIEGLMYKLIPVINTVHNMKSDRGSEGNKKADGHLADTDDSTYKVYIELRKKSDTIDDNLTKGVKRYSVEKKRSNNIENKVSSIEPKIGLSHNQVLSGEDNEKIEKIIRGHLELVKSQPAEVESQSNNLVDFQLSKKHVQSIKKREAKCDSGRPTQIRGGQRCSKRGRPPDNCNPQTYFESAHCLRYSDLWYNVFKLFNPRLENSITVKVYAKHKTPDKRICWENLTKRLPGRVGTVNEILVNEEKTMTITYSSDDKVAWNLDCASDYLLVPQPLPRYCKDSELKKLSFAGPEEYLVLKESEITFSGDECDKAGVNYAAFARQEHRCQVEAGSCVRNQPLDFWRKDKKRDRLGKGGHYFLKNFVEVTEQAILQNTTSNQVVLRAPYKHKYRSEVVMEMSADHLEIIGDKSEGQITEVYTDATSEKVTVVKAVITNMGVASDFYGVDFANCTYRLGPSDFDKPGKDEIPPQHRITYTATINSPRRSRQIECRMVLYNQDHEMVASRHIIIVDGLRCMCVWHCQCVCYDRPGHELHCNPLSIPEYNRAGFPGHLPTLAGSDCSTLFTVLHAVFWFFLFLLLFGLIKGIVGILLPHIGLWGLWYLLPDEAKSLQCYLEPQYASVPVARDCDGFPIHPRTYKRGDVHFLPWYSEILVNIFFFIFVLLNCLCDHGSYRRGPSGMYYQERSFPRGRNKCCSPKCTVRNRSPCGSVCSPKRNRKFRIAAGGEEEFLNPDPQLLKDDEWAKRLVDELTRSYVVFRILSRPMGGVKSVPGTPYCIRGFFLESDNGMYEFSPPSPLMQIWQMDGTPLDPPIRLDPTPFHALYRNSREVLGAHELSPWARGVVINAP